MLRFKGYNIFNDTLKEEEADSRTYMSRAFSSQMDSLRVVGRTPANRYRRAWNGTSRNSGSKMQILFHNTASAPGRGRTGSQCHASTRSC